MASSKKKGAKSKSAKQPNKALASKSKGVSKTSKKQATFHTPEGLVFRDEEQKQRYEVLSKRQLMAIRYVDDSTLKLLGLFDDVHTLFANVGWDKFVSIRAPTYKEITLEFLSSFQTHFSYCQTDKLSISFRLHNTEYKLTLFQLCDIFGLDHDGNMRCPGGFNFRTAWHEISGTSIYVDGVSKSTDLQKSFRYVHRFLGHTVFARGAKSQVNQDDVYILWAMLNKVKVNPGVWIIKRLAKIAGSFRGDIVIEGLITSIAKFLGVTQFGKAITDSQFIDLSMCSHMELYAPFSVAPNINAGTGETNIENDDDRHSPLPQLPAPHDYDISPWMLYDIMMRLEAKVDSIGAKVDSLEQKVMKLMEHSPSPSLSPSL